MHSASNFCPEAADWPLMDEWMDALIGPGWENSQRLAKTANNYVSLFITWNILKILN
jgi:hypothetical protein